MPMSTLTSKYQATIPKVVREALALGAGDRIEFLIEPAGMIQLRKAPRLDAELRAIELIRPHELPVIRTGTLR